MFTVGELSKLTGVTVRALHHYDELGLVLPSERSAAGYRLYGDADVRRLQQVLLLRELGLPLDAIGAALADRARRDELLRDHRGLLVDKRARLDAMLAAVDSTLEKGPIMSPLDSDDVTALFDGFDPAQHEAEAKARWGATESYKESARRTKSYGKPEWEAINSEVGAIYATLVTLMQAGAAPRDAAVQAAVAEHRAHIDRWFYACSIDMHKGLAEMYIADPRFTENLDKQAPGFARFLRDAIAAT
jgi:DNA-binding transcriptional MerR regulator